MREIKLLDRTQPQTLVIGSLLLYLNAGFALLTMLFGGLSLLSFLLVIALPVGGAYGVANSKRVGYYVALAATGLQVLFVVYEIYSLGLSTVIGGGLLGLLNLILVVIPFVLFVHPLSRNYAKTWFH